MEKWNKRRRHIFNVVGVILYKFGPNGFNSAWGNRNYGKNYTKFTHYYIRKKLNETVIITNLNFFDFIEFLKTEEKDNPNITMFLDPPYYNSGKAGYTSNFKKEEYLQFLNIIQESKYNIAYTDVENGDINWDYILLRESMINKSPKTAMLKNGNKEVIYYNK